MKYRFSNFSEGWLQGKSQNLRSFDAMSRHNPNQNLFDVFKQVLLLESPSYFLNEKYSHHIASIRYFCFPAASAGALQGMSIPIARSILSKIVRPNEVGEYDVSFSKNCI